METPATIRALAALRLEEATVLIQQGKPDGAFYLAGYSIDLTLKARIAERLGVSSLFADQPLPNDQFGDSSKLRQLVRTHSLELLMVLGGLWPAYAQVKAVNRAFAKFDSLFQTWNEQLRYRPPGQVSAVDVQQFIDFINSSTGLLSWIANSLKRICSLS